MPYTDIAEPSLLYDLKLIALPMWKKSSTDMQDPTLFMPKTEIPLP
jgi:hypothetical protein